MCNLAQEWRGSANAPLTLLFRLRQRFHSKPGSTAVPTVFNNATLLTATVPGNLLTTPGTVNVTVQNPGGAASGAVGYTITEPSPMLKSISPTSVLAGSASFVLAANGSGFYSGTVLHQRGGANNNSDRVNASDGKCLG